MEKSVNARARHDASLRNEAMRHELHKKKEQKEALREKINKEKEEQRRAYNRRKAEQEELKAELNRIREEHKREKERRKAEQRDAMASAYAGKTRQSAAQIKRKLSRAHLCPYCGKGLGTDPHADHIHPVAKGGMSTEDNMVFVCQPCNARKRDLTLHQFIEKK